MSQSGMLSVNLSLSQSGPYQTPQSEIQNPSGKVSCFLPELDTG